MDVPHQQLGRRMHGAVRTCFLLGCCWGLLLVPGVCRGQLIQFTYSYSNFFDGTVQRQNSFTEREMLRAVEEALALWASVAPLEFVEVPDRGPDVSDSDYSSAGTPDIRVGHHEFTGNTLGHAYFPGNTGLASDVHLDSSDRVWSESLFFTTAAHELGHALGLDHLDSPTALMNPTIGGDNRLPSVDEGFLFEADIQAIQNQYGIGAGRVVTTRDWSPSGASTAWDNRANWQQGQYPTRYSQVSLGAGEAVMISGIRADANQVTLGGRAQLSVAASGTLTVTENLTLGDAAGGIDLVPLGANARYQVPTATTPSDWNTPSFDDSSWAQGVSGFGYDRAGDYNEFIGTDVESVMFNQASSLYTRFEFDVTDPSELDFLALDLQYDDGVVAYLNGIEVVSENAPTLPVWSSAAPRSRADGDATEFQTIDLTEQIPNLLAGTNVLSLHALNARAGSSDLLVVPRLRGDRLDDRLTVNGGTVAIGGDLTIAEAPGSSSNVDIESGRLEINGNVQTGAGTSHVTLRGGTFYVAGGNAAERWVNAGDVARYHVPVDDRDSSRWTTQDFDDSTWSTGPTGLGYDRDTGYESLISTDVEDAMYGTNASLLTRLAFDLDADHMLGELYLDLQFDDGFVAYLNGVRIAESNAPNSVQWNSRATDSRDDDDARAFQSFDVSDFQHLLVEGENILAIQLLNASPTNSDTLLVPTLRQIPLSGVLEVGELEFYGGQLEGVRTIVGDVRHLAGTLSPQIRDTRELNIGSWTIDGNYALGPEATLRLEIANVGGANADRLDVVQTATLEGTLDIVIDDSLVDAFLADDRSRQGQGDKWVLLTANTLEAGLAAWTINGVPAEAEHVRDGLFRWLNIESQEVSLDWYVARPGDSDGDGLFNSTDLVTVFTAGEYEDDVLGNSDWTRGDWSGDGDFTTSDLVLAFADGSYVFTAKGNAKSIPEPAAATQGVIAAMTMLLVASATRGRRL